MFYFFNSSFSYFLSPVHIVWTPVIIDFSHCCILFSPLVFSTFPFPHLNYLGAESMTLINSYWQTQFCEDFYFLKSRWKVLVEAGGLCISSHKYIFSWQWSVIASDKDEARIGLGLIPDFYSSRFLCLVVFHLMTTSRWCVLHNE